MFLFQQVEDAKAIVKMKGVYKQTDVYQRQGYLYVQHGSGYAALIRGNVTPIGTSVANLLVDDLYMPDSFDNKVWITKGGRLCLEQCEYKHKEFEIGNV